MNLFDSLLKIFPKLKNISAFNNIKLSINIGNKYVIEKKTLNIDYSKLSENEKEEIISKLPEALNKGDDILEANFERETIEYKEIIADPSLSETLSFFQDKIPINDVPILKASLYLKYLLDSGEETTKIKHDITMRFGVRGRNISNLCSANYFENWFKPLYEEMSKYPDFVLTKFQKAYEEIVANLPFTVFVHSNMKGDEVKKSILEKVDLMNKYGFENLYVHGIGESNIQTIKKVVDEIVKEGKLVKYSKEENNIIIVTLKNI